MHIIIHVKRQQKDQEFKMLEMPVQIFSYYLKGLTMSLAYDEAELLGQFKSADLAAI